MKSIMLQDSLRSLFGFDIFNESETSALVWEPVGKLDILMIFLFFI